MTENVKVARYYNSNGVGTAIVAVVNTHNGEIFDWAAYIGGSERGAAYKEWAVEDVARGGCKLMLKDAHHYFPSLPLGKYRP